MNKETDCKDTTKDVKAKVTPNTRMDKSGHVMPHTHTDESGHIMTYAYTDESGHVMTHTHTDECGHVITHTHAVGEKSEHGHYHSPEVKKKQINRLAKAIGHLQHVKGLIENDEDCAQVLMQLAAVESALHSLGKEIISEHMTHCITHAIEDGDTRAVEEFQKAISKYM